MAESAETRTIVVDARMLAYPLTGIGRYVLELLSRLAARPRTHWVLLSAGPVPAAHRALVRGSVEWVEGPASQRAELWTQRIAARELRRRPGATFLGLGNSVPFLGPHRTRCCLVIYDLSFLVVPSLTEVIDLVKAFAVTLPSVWKADRIIAISPQVQSELHRFIRSSRGRTIALPPGGTRLRVGSPVSYEERSGFVTVGAHRRKNTKLLLEAYALLPRRVRAEHPLVIVARRLPARLERLVHGLGLSADVQLAPDASDAELGRIYGHSRALVYPSAYEGLGLPVAEAILAGLPSIVPQGSPMEHFLAGAGVVVNRLEPSALADAMQALAGDCQLWERCAAAAARGAEQFNWDRVAEATARALEI